jgi:hypothetical protein
MTNEAYIKNIRTLIAQNELDEAIKQLRLLLGNSPKLDEAILQSARFHDIRRQIRLGLVSHAEANLTQNQIRAGLLELLHETEEQSKKPILKLEMEHAISIVNSKNVVVGSTITAGGNVEIGDRTIHTVSETSRYFESEENTEGDTQPIGIVLAKEKDELLVQYAMHNISSQLFVSKYQLYLPNREELQALITNQLNKAE